MKKNRRTRLAAVLLFILLIVLPLGVAGISYGLLGYSLTPQSDNRNKPLKWQQADSLYPGLKAWRDSLQAAGAWRDTVITASDGTHLFAEYVRTASASRRTAVLVHGYTDCNVDMMALGRMYARDLDMNILLPDLRYAGNTGGTHIQMGWLDRLDVLQWVRTVPCLFGDSAEVVVHGVSMGAATTMMLSGEADVPASVRAYVEDCGYTSVTEQFGKELWERFSLPSFPFIPVASAMCRQLYGWDFDQASALRQVARCRRPMLFIHGTADRFVPTRMVRPLYEAHPGPKELWLVPGVAHARSYHDFTNEYTQRVRCFLEKHMGND